MTMVYTNENTLLQTIDTFDVENVTFSPAINCTQPTPYKRINIGYRNADGTVGELVLQTERVYTFGFSEQTDFTDKTKVVGYTLPLVLHSKGGATQNELKWIENLNDIVERCKEHTLSVKASELKRFDLEKSDFKKGFNPLFYKKDKDTGARVPGTGPLLYAKVIGNRERKTVVSLFSTEDGTPFSDPVNQLMKKPGYARAAIKIESIYVGPTIIALQVKLAEAVLWLTETTTRRLLVAAPTDKTMEKSSGKAAVHPTVPPVKQTEDEEVQQNDNDDEEDEEVEEVAVRKPLKPAPVVSKPVAPTVKITAKKK